MGKTKCLIKEDFCRYGGGRFFLQEGCEIAFE